MRFGYGRVAKAMRLLLSAVKFVCGLLEVCLGDHFIRTRGCVSCQCMAREVTDFKRVKKWMTPRKLVPAAARFSGEAERGNWRCRGRKCVGNGRKGEIVRPCGSGCRLCVPGGGRARPSW